MRPQGPDSPAAPGTYSPPLSPALGNGAHGLPVDLPEVGVFGIGIHAIGVTEAAGHILAELDRDRGGWLVPSNLDHIVRTRKDPDFREIYEEATLRIPEGQNMVWACHLQRSPLPERVSVATLILTLAEGARDRSRSLFLLGGGPGMAEASARVLAESFPGLTIHGAEDFPEGADADPLALARVSRRIDATKPDLVLVALETPLQERVIRHLRHDRPEAWWIGVGDGLRFVAGDLKSAPRWMERSGLEWVHRMWQEPRRLFHRYLVLDAPRAAWLLFKCGVRGMIPKGKSGIYGRRPSALIVDDDRNALDHLELLLSSRFPQLQIETRTEPDTSGVHDFYFLDNDFGGNHLAAPMAAEVRLRRPRAVIVAFSGVLDVPTLKRLINAGCDGVCDKAQPKNWRPILELMDRRLRAFASGNRGTTLGGVRRAARSIQELLADWNARHAAAGPGVEVRAAEAVSPERVEA